MGGRCNHSRRAKRSMFFKEMGNGGKSGGSLYVFQWQSRYMSSAGQGCGKDEPSSSVLASQFVIILQYNHNRKLYPGEMEDEGTAQFGRPTTVASRFTQDPIEPTCFFCCLRQRRLAETCLHSELEITQRHAKIKEIRLWYDAASPGQNTPLSRFYRSSSHVQSSYL